MHSIEPLPDRLDVGDDHAGYNHRSAGHDTRVDLAGKLSHARDTRQSEIAVSLLFRAVFARHLSCLRHRYRAVGSAPLWDNETSDPIRTDQRLEGLERRGDDHSAVIPECEALFGNGVKNLAFSLAANLCDSLGAPDRLVQVPGLPAKLDDRH